MTHLLVPILALLLQAPLQSADPHGSSTEAICIIRGVILRDGVPSVGVRVIAYETPKANGARSPTSKVEESLQIARSQTDSHGRFTLPLPAFRVYNVVAVVTDNLRYPIATVPVVDDTDVPPRALAAASKPAGPTAPALAP